MREAAGLIAFRFSSRDSNWALIVHPLWDCEELPGIVGDALDELVRWGAREQSIRFVNTFELARRQVRVREDLLLGWRT